MHTVLMQSVTRFFSMTLNAKLFYYVMLTCLFHTVNLFVSLSCIVLLNFILHLYCIMKHSLIAYCYYVTECHWFKINVTTFYWKMFCFLKHNVTTFYCTKSQFLYCTMSCIVPFVCIICIAQSRNVVSHPSGDTNPRSA